MTRKDYEHIAGMLKEVRPEEFFYTDDADIAYVGGWKRACEAIALSMCINNPKFIPGKFLLSCGYTQDEVTQGVQRVLEEKARRGL